MNTVSAVCFMAAFALTGYILGCIKGYRSGLQDGFTAFGKLINGVEVETSNGDGEDKT